MPALGQWKNAPLAYVLAQVRFEAILEMEGKYLGAFQDAIRDRYPRFSASHELGLKITEEGVSQSEAAKAWDFHSVERTKCVRVSTNALTYLATEYKTFDEFSSELHWVIAAFHKAVGKVLVTRIGVRYVDFIIPSTGHTPEDYVVAPMNTMPDIGASGEATTFNYYDYPFDNGKLILKYMRGLGKPELPPDLMPSTMTPPPIMKKEVVGGSAILDTDRFQVFDGFMEPAQIMESIRTIHDDLSRAFKSSTTDYAKQEWGAQV